MADRYRTEREFLGPVEVPSDAYYGASTARAVVNFPISPLRFSRGFLRALGLIKLAAARANAELGLLDPQVARAIAGQLRKWARDGMMSSL